MSAEILRKAAALMREEWSGTTQQEFYDAVADWLSMSADHAAGRGSTCGSCVDQAVTVARAYLGGDDD